MFPLLIVLTALSLIALVAGVAWTLALVGQTQRRSGTDVGAEVIAERMADDEADSVVVAQRTAFRGKATSVEAGAEFSFAEIKSGLQAGRWREMFPLLLAMGGFFGLLVFGPLAFLVGVENKLIGVAVVAVALFAVVRTLVAFARS